MDFGLSGKRAMVAAGSAGIGLAVAKELTAEGCQVSICGRSQERLDSALVELGSGAVGFVADVSTADGVNEWFNQSVESLGGVDILVTNTGGPPAGPWTEMTDEQWQSGFDSTLMNLVRMVRLASPLMVEQGWGRIVHITSLVAKEPVRLLPISATLRSGIMALTKLQAKELAAQGVTVNGILPGHTKTDRQMHLAEVIAARDGVTVEEALASRGAEVPVGRLAEASEIAAAVCFLCSARASYLTGESILVDGGLVSGI